MYKKKVFVSFVIATYNCESRVHILEKTVKKLQDFSCEFIVADGGSKDTTLQKLRAIQNLIVAVSKPDAGIYDAWNRALNFCSGEYISFLGVDDVPEVNFLENALNSANTNKLSKAIYYGDYLLTLGNKQRTKKSPQNPLLFNSEAPIFDIPHPGCLNHRDLFEKNQFDPAFKLAGDFEFYLNKRDLILRMGYQKLNGIQSTIDSTGLSRSASSFDIYLKEFKLLEEKYNIKINSKLRQKIFGIAFSKLPNFFQLIKSLSWAINSERIR
jgi:glycosyltransferase involved in cell wall biosynthesis